MNEVKSEKKISAGVIVLIISLIALLVGCIGFISYDKFLNGNNNSFQVEKLYSNFSNNLKLKMNEKYDDYKYNVSTINSKIISQWYEVRLNKNGTLYIKYEKENSNKKIAEQVLSFYLINSGQDERKTLFFIKYDGTVSSAEIEVENSDSIKIENNIYNLKNIVSIVEGTFGNEFSGVNGPIFIDIEGNIYSYNF